MGRDERGFTLVEVLVASAVLAAGILGFVQATVVAERLRARADALGQAVLLAEDGLERVAALGWEAATAGLGQETWPGLGEVPGPVPSLRLASRGVDYLVLFERAADGTTPAPCTLRCYWAAPGDAFEPCNGVVLRTRPR